jgi:D-lactate dehydrogenase
VRISIFEAEEQERETLKCKLSDRHDLRFDPKPLTRDLALRHADADAISTFLYSDLGREVLGLFDDLRLVATRSTGIDHVDTRWCREHGVTVTNVPSYGATAVAEHVFALLLALSHHIVEAADRTRRGDFSRGKLRGFDLLGRTMGVVGTGDIGRHTVRVAKGFGMNVVAFDIAPDEDLARTLGFRYLPLPDLLARCDVITLHVPGGEKTHHLIAEDEFRAMKPATVFINTSRGSVVDTAALLRALSDGTVAAAGLDVLEEEPAIREEAELIRSVFSRRHEPRTLLGDHILLRMRNVLITPHSAFDTQEAEHRILETTTNNIEAYVAGQPKNTVG